jgi:hypothetical protein
MICSYIASFSYGKKTRGSIAGKCSIMQVLLLCRGNSKHSAPHILILDFEQILRGSFFMNPCFHGFPNISQSSNSVIRNTWDPQTRVTKNVSLSPTSPLILLGHASSPLDAPIVILDLSLPACAFPLLHLANSILSRPAVCSTSQTTTQ